MTEDLKNIALDFIRGHPYCQFVTIDKDMPFSRVMFVPEVEDDFTVWLATSGASKKVSHVKSNKNVCITFYEAGVYIRISGTAVIDETPAKKAALWRDTWLQYWPDGAKDPDYVLIKITPASVAYLNVNKGFTTEEIL